MKEEFFGFYDPTDEEIDKSWKSGLFIFDTNALLNLYRYSASTRNDFLLTIETLKDRLFMPFQVGLEFHSNRRAVIEGLKHSYSVMSSGIKELLEKNLKNHLNQFVRHPSIELERIQKLQDDFSKNIFEELEKQKKNHPDFEAKDDILNKLTDIYTGKVGKCFSKDELKKIFDEGKERYAQSIPPGYKDLDGKKKKGEQHVYGDLIIWKEIIRCTSKEKKQVIFVTDDRKEDWWTIENGKTIRPREELIKEFYDLTGIRILIYNTDNFLHFAKERKLATEIKDTSIAEIEEVRKTDETYNQISTILSAETFNIANKNLTPVTSSLDEILKSESEIKKPYYPLATKWSEFAESDYLKYLLDKKGRFYHFPMSHSLDEIINSSILNDKYFTPLKVSLLLSNWINKDNQSIPVETEKSEASLVEGISKNANEIDTPLPQQENNNQPENPVNPEEAANP